MYSFTSVGTATWQILFVTETLRVKLSNIVCSKLSITSIGFSSKVGLARACAHPSLDGATQFLSP